MAYDQLKTLSENQLAHLIKQAVDDYHNEDYVYTVRNINSPNVNSTEKKVTFNVEIKCCESGEESKKV